VARAHAGAEGADQAGHQPLAGASPEQQEAVKQRRNWYRELPDDRKQELRDTWQRLPEERKREFGGARRDRAAAGTGVDGTAAQGHRVTVWAAIAAQVGALTGLRSHPTRRIPSAAAASQHRAPE